MMNCPFFAGQTPECSVETRLSWSLFGSLSLFCPLPRGNFALAYKHPPSKGVPKAGDVFFCTSLSSHNRHLEKAGLIWHTPSRWGMIAFYNEYLILPRTVAKSAEIRGNPSVGKRILPRDANIHAKEYQRYLPSKQLRQAKRLEWARVEEAKA